LLSLSLVIFIRVSSRPGMVAQSRDAVIHPAGDEGVRRL